jgi:hypothetical protein
MKEVEDWRGLRLRYLNGNRRVKADILRSLELVCGYHRKSAIRVLRGELNRRLRNQQCQAVKKPGAKSRYQDPLFRDALRRLWRELDYMCSKNLKKALPEWLPFYEQEHCEFLPEIRTKLLIVSASTIDRLLKPHKHLGRGRCGTTPGTLLRSEIPISTTCWDIAEPGFLEGDTVAHCGGSLMGEFVWTLTATDICTTWTEVRPVWHKGAKAVVEAIEDIQASLPFAIKGWDCDNGGEFINRTLVKHFADHRITFTRSRSYHKNDNCHVEQRNYTHARQLLGYGRIDNHDVMEPLLEILRLWSMLKNHFYPTRKLIQKVCLGSKTKKIYDEPRTPYERALAHTSVSEQMKTELQAAHRVLNPVVLRKQIRSSVRLLMRHASVSTSVAGSFRIFGNTEL